MTTEPANEAPINHDLPDMADRIAFLFPAFDGTLDDLDDESTRLTLLEAEHPEEGELADPERRRLHTSLHLIVANQVLGDIPPQVWPTLQRITGRGYTRHDALHMVAAGMSDVLFRTLQGRPPGPELYLGYLAGLPEQSVRPKPAPTSRTGGGAGRRAKRR